MLKRQYHAGLAMLREAVERCTDELWLSDAYRNRCWQLAYHTLFFTHAYLQPNEASFRPWKEHQGDVQHEDGIAGGPPNPDSTLPVIPNPYTREQVLAYCDFCDAMVNDAIDAMDVWSQESGFHWYQYPKLEHQLINLRHLQHGAAQLADRVRAKLNLGIRWVGSKPGAPIRVE